MPEPLLPQVADGDPGAMRQCVERYGSLIWSLARRFLGNGTDADDATQEVFIELWRAAGSFEASCSSEKTFVIMVARRRLIDYRRRTTPRIEIQSLPGESFLPERADVRSIELQEEAQLAVQVLSQLRPEQRAVIEMVIYAGLSHEQIAQKTGLPLGTVKTHIRRGLIQLREELNRQENARERTWLSTLLHRTASPDLFPRGTTGGRA